MAEQQHDPLKVTLLDVRLSFAALFETDKRKNDDGTIVEKWKANFLIDKDEMPKAMYMGKKMDAMQACKLASKAAKAKKFGDNESQWPKIKPDRVFLRDGDLEDWPGYAGNFYVSANANLEERPKVITNRKVQGSWVPAEPGSDNAPYSGCYVNAVVTVWAQDNEHGKRVNARVKAVQFVRDGEAFGAAPVNVDDEFTDDMIGEEGSLGEDDDNGTVDDGDDDLI